MSASATTQRKSIKQQPLGGYWRVPVFALVGALIAFGISFVFKSQYPSASRLIIRTGETSYASTDSAATIGDNINIGGIDLTKQQTLGNTLVNLALSRQAAAAIVDKLGGPDVVLEGETPSKGFTSKIVDFLKVGSTGAAPTEREAAIDKVQGSLEAAVLDESWVMELTAWDPNPRMARQIANAAADVVVTQSADRFKENSLRELDYLTAQLARARDDVAAKAQAVADFKSANGLITDTSGDTLAGALSPSAPSNLDTLNNNLVGLRAKEQVLRNQLSSTPRTLVSTGTNLDGSPSRIETPNPTYASTQQQLQQVQSDIAVAEAQFNSLASRLGGGTAPGVNELQAQLTQLQNDLQIAQDNYKTLNERFGAVSATVEKPRYDATRLGEAPLPTSPGRPLRYLFLLVGGLVGALAGLLLTWFRIIREEDADAADDGDDHVAGSGHGGVPLDEDTFIVDVREPVRANGEQEPGRVPQLNRGATDLLSHPAQPNLGGAGA